MLNSYPKVYNLGHPAIREVFDGPVTVEEKLDGSQFSFGAHGGHLKCRSKGVELDINAPEKMFVLGVEYAKKLHGACLLTEGWTYRCEFLNKPKHNTLAYDRTPKNNLCLFDVMVGFEDYADRATLEVEAARLDIDAVPLLFQGEVAGPDELEIQIDRVSYLGGAKIEGVVIKNRQKFGKDGKPLFAKYVSAEFKEIHQGEWRKNNPTPTDVRAMIAQKFCTPARWQKAVQHLAERGELTGLPNDIGPLMKEVHLDFDEECREQITAELLKWAMPEIKRQACRGLPEWYKEKLGMGNK